MTKEDVDFFRELGPSGRNLTPASFVGVSTLPDQFVNLQLKRGFCFNIMCIGSSGVGKTSLLHTLFRRPFSDDPHPARSEDVSLVFNHYDMKEANVNLKVTFVESRGFGDQVNKTASTVNLVKYINDQYNAYLNEENKIKRSLETYQDKRIHACIYMISPTGHSLNALDILAMKDLYNKVNLIPIIGKADILTKNELKEFKARINKDLREHGIQIYHFPTDDPSISAKNADMNERMPFAVVSSAEEETINNQLCRVRKYPWGTVVIDDDHHCEFQLLREMVLRSNLYDLIRTTHDTYYEEYRLSVFNNGGIQIDAEMTEDIKRKNQMLAQSTEREIEQLKSQYENDLKNISDKYHLIENQMEETFQKSLYQCSLRKESLLEDNSQLDKTNQTESENQSKVSRNTTVVERAENIVRELKRFRGLSRQQSNTLHS